MKKIHMRSQLVGTVIGSAALLCVGAGSTTQTATEYKVVTGSITRGELESAINKAAADGWNFLDTSKASEGYGYVIMSRTKPKP